MANLSADELIRAVQNDPKAGERELALLEKLVSVLDEVDALTRELQAAQQASK